MADDRKPSDAEMTWRVDQLERQVGGLTEHAVSREWLDERLGRTEDAIDAAVRESASARRELERDIAELKSTERSRRNLSFGAFLSAVVAVLVALISQVPL